MRLKRSSPVQSVGLSQKDLAGLAAGQVPVDETNEAYYARRAQEELDLASAASDRAEKEAHLNLASEYATARERAARSIASPTPKSRT